MKMHKSKRGEIWYVDLEPSKGSEFRKNRPCVVLSHDSIDLPMRIICPITGWREKYKGSLWHVGLTPTDENGLDKKSVVDVFHIRSVSTERFKNKIGVVTAEQLDDIAAAIAIVVDMPL